MSDYAFNYSFNITGNASTAAQQITGDVTALNNTVKQATGIWDSFAGKVVAFNQLSQFVEGFSRTVDETLAPGAALNASLADLSAISGETGESLKRSSATRVMRQRRSAVRQRRASNRTNCCSRSSPRNLPKLRTPSKLWGTISPY